VNFQSFVCVLRVPPISYSWLDHPAIWYEECKLLRVPLILFPPDSCYWHVSSERSGATSTTEARSGAFGWDTALHSEGRGFHSPWCHNPSGRIMALGSTQPLIEVSTRNSHWNLHRSNKMCFAASEIGSSAFPVIVCCLVDVIRVTGYALDSLTARFEGFALLGMWGCTAVAPNFEGGGFWTLIDEIWGTLLWS
jgi:hypothetical protein